MENKMTQDRAMRLLFALACHDDPHVGTPQEPFKHPLVKGKELRSRAGRDRVRHGLLSQLMFSGHPSVMQAGGKEVEVHAFAGSGDLPRLAHADFNINRVVTAYDTLWQAAFQGVMLGEREISWEIVDVTSGVRFDEIPEGARVKLYNYSGTKTTIGTAKYGSQIGQTIEAIRGNRLSQFVQVVEMARDALFTLWADVHYGLLKAGATTGGTVSYQGAGTDAQVVRDARTINTARLTITKACRNLFATDTAMAPVLLYAPPDLEDRILRAMNAGSEGGRAETARRMQPLFSWHADITNTGSTRALMVLPGRKIQNATVAQELSFSREDQDTLSRLQTYWSWFGGTVAETNQLRFVDFA